MKKKTITKLSLTRRALGVVLMTLMVSCSLWDEYQVEVVYAPRLVLSLDAMAARDIKSLHVYTFNSTDQLVHDTILTDVTEISDPTGLTIAKWLEPGEYTAVVYGNVKTSRVSDVVRGTTTKSELSALTSNGLCDSLYHRVHTATLVRGDPQVQVIEPLPLFYNIEISIVGVNELTVPLKKPMVKLHNIPLKYDATGVEIATPRSSLTPVLETLSNGDFRTALRIPRFVDASAVQLQILDNERNLQQVTLAPSLFLTDPLRDVSLNMVVQFSRTSVTISVNNWFLGNFEIIDLGN